MTLSLSKKILPMSLMVLLSACSMLGLDDDPKSKLEGDRLSLYDFEKSLQQDPSTQFGMDGTEGAANIIALPDALKGGMDDSISLVAPWTNDFWPQVGGYPNHAMKHVAFTKDKPSRAWSSSIGRGATDRMPLTAPPIMADGRIYTINNNAEIYAFDVKNGKKIWSSKIIKKGEDEPVIGGGLAFSGNILFATNGFNEVLALNPLNGNILWRADTKTPVRAAPSAIPGRVFVMTMDNQTLAFDATNGKKLWSHRGLSSDAGVLGAATPAISRDAVIAAYSSGEVYALQIDTGLALWSENLSPLARVAGQTSLSDIRALPVIDNNIVYAASYTNRMSAVDARTGQPIWQIPVGTASTPWVSGNRIYIVESQGTLMSLDRANGNMIWQTALPRFKDVKDREGVIAWQGPILAGGRLILLGSNGEARDFNPVNGELIRTWDLNNAVTLAPAIAKGTLYTVSNNGNLTAWR